MPSAVQRAKEKKSRGASSTKRKLRSSTRKKNKKKRKRSEVEKDEQTVSLYVDKFAYMDDENYGINEKYEEERKEYSEQQVAKRRKVEEDPNATTITYVKSGNQTETQLTVRTMAWMSQNWTNVKGNQEFGTYATVVKVDEQPFYFRANNTKDVGLASMSLGEKDKTYVSSTFRSFETIGSELNSLVSTADDSKKMRKRIGQSILGAIKTEASFGCTTTNFTNLQDADLYWVQSMIAEVAAIWALDLCRAEDNWAKVLEHQKSLLLGKQTFTQIFKPGVYLGMKAADLRS